MSLDELIKFRVDDNFSYLVVEACDEIFYVFNLRNKNERDKAEFIVSDADWFVVGWKISRKLPSWVLSAKYQTDSAIEYEIDAKYAKGNNVDANNEDVNGDDYGDNDDDKDVDKDGTESDVDDDDNVDEDEDTDVDVNGGVIVLNDDDDDKSSNDEDEDDKDDDTNADVQVTAVKKSLQQEE